MNQKLARKEYLQVLRKNLLPALITPAAITAFGIFVFMCDRDFEVERRNELRNRPPITDRLPNKRSNKPICIENPDMRRQTQQFVAATCGELEGCGVHVSTQLQVGLTRNGERAVKQLLREKDGINFRGSMIGMTVEVTTTNPDCNGFEVQVVNIFGTPQQDSSFPSQKFFRAVARMVTDEIRFGSDGQKIIAEDTTGRQGIFERIIDRVWSG